MQQAYQRSTATPVVDEVYRNIFKIKTPLTGSPLRYVNSYLIKGDNRNMLIDTGYGNDSCIATIRKGLAVANARLEETDILLTHFHNDHSGAATRLIHPSRKIYVPAQEFTSFDIGHDPDYYQASRKSRYLEEGLTEKDFQEIMSIRKPGSVGPDFFCKQFAKVHNNDVFSVGDYRLEAIHTPGHTPGHMCYWEKNHKIMFTGDHLLFDVSSNVIPWAGIPNMLGTYLYSLRQLKKYDVELALPGHRNPGNWLIRIEEMLDHHEKRLNECEAIVKLYQDKTAFEITEYLSWKIRNPNRKRAIPVGLMRYAFGECLCHLDHLYYLGRINKTMKNGHYRYD